MGARDTHARSPYVQVAECCERPPAVLGPHAARLILDPYFRALREEFVADERSRFGGSRLSRVRLDCASWRELGGECTARNFAAASEDGRLIVAAPELVELPEETVLAILAHELGHCYDFSYPGEWLLADGELVRVHADERDPMVERVRLARARAWRDRDEDTVERIADEIASLILGREIRYAGPCLLQTFDRGVVRPEGLR